MLPSLKLSDRAASNRQFAGESYVQLLCTELMLPQDEYRFDLPIPPALGFHVGGGSFFRLPPSLVPVLTSLKSAQVLNSNIPARRWQDTAYLNTLG
jgi:hypothetical protein